ncbi:hypothetical protein SCLCIDRAFT_269395 [Scleroderma citrinum Foug A]|uniref:Uncharacterized protein n=1 Tax=Scleroderma citrinum Foug A TaxID=1036808 RepID=A0A0C2Z299_9AGAM|nr:hypothetical protein SCLCIDRAFT_269395 [Scleroderma citrinum Foug A]
MHATLSWSLNWTIHQRVIYLGAGTGLVNSFFRVLPWASCGAAGVDVAKISLRHQEAGVATSDHQQPLFFWHGRLIEVRPIYITAMLANSRLLAVALSAPCGCCSPLAQPNPCNNSHPRVGGRGCYQKGLVYTWLWTLFHSMLPKKSNFVGLP